MLTELKVMSIYFAAMIEKLLVLVLLPRENSR
jgi:hypothetical protein